MLPARRNRNWLHIAELSLATTLVVGTATAQSTGATSSPTNSATASTPVAPTAEPSTAANTSAPTPASTSRVDLADSDADAAEPSLVVRDVPLRKPPESARWLLIGVGLGSTAMWWAGAYGIGELWPGADYRTQLRIPVAGPFIDLGHTGCPDANPSCSTFQLVFRTILVTLDAVGQVGGVAMVLQGATLGTASAKAPVSNQAAIQRHSPRSPVVLPVPWIDGNRGGGLGLVGQF